MIGGRLSPSAVVAVVVAITAFFVLHEGRGFPPRLASMGGLAIGALPYVAWRAFTEIRKSLTQLGPPPEEEEEDS